MAIYEYKCRIHQQVISFKRSMNDPEPDYFCEICNEKLTRIFNPPPIKFNASGFSAERG